MAASAERGSALMVVLIALLVLTAIGMAVVMVTEGERNTAYDEMYTQDALYVAEMGLRVGEQILLAATVSAADTLLGHAAVADTPVVTPTRPVFPRVQGEYDVAHLGTYLTAGGAELANVPVALPAPPNGRNAAQGFYSLYVRNNNTDIAVLDGNLATDARQDNDSIVNLVAVGWVQFGDQVQAVKIIEEEYAWDDFSQDPSSQKLSDAGGTGSGQFGG